MLPDENLYGDAYQPAQIAVRVRSMGVAKAKADALSVLLLAFMAGVYISLGALLYVIVTTDNTIGFGLSKLAGGFSFCLGLILVVIGGAELFTGNNLLAMAWSSKLISTKDMLRNWVLVYVGNVFGCITVVILIYLADTASFSQGHVGENLVQIAKYKTELSIINAFARGVLCNILVCLAVWLAMGGHTVIDKIAGIIFPVTAFVVMGFEHSVANWFFLPIGLILDHGQTIQLSSALMNILIVSLGNIAGGTVIVAGIYWVAYLRNDKSTT
jgi:formate/nitrite transporter